ncbi:MAG: sodium:solute symporter family protein [Candidatus Scalinduaceae bacterium]
MQLAIIDWLIIGGYCVFALFVGIYFSKRASKNIREFFLSGSTLPWWLVGTSMVATTFAADTPLAVTEYVRSDGIWRNWFWWNASLGGLLSVFLFSRLWRRTSVLTDNELIEIRYSGKPASILRGFKALYFSTIYNFVVMGWVIQAMSTVFRVTLDIPEERQWISIGICVVIALAYTVLSGFWGVVVTDLIQFIIAMGGAITLAVFSLNAVGGMSELKLQLASIDHVSDSVLYFFPPINSSMSPLTAEFWSSPFFMFLVFISIMWWSTHNADGGGYIIQRMLSSKDERHSLYATLWFNIAQYALRVWPWIIVALVSLVVFPNITEGKAAYPMAINKFLPAGLKGLLIVSFLAAFMSTIDTHLNWGTSYFINDLYKRFIVKEAKERHYVIVSRICVVILMLIAAVAASFMDSITRAWEFLIPMGAGIGLVLILRWFWWRINAWSEISGLTASLIINLILQPLDLSIQHRVIIIVPSSILVWVTVTLLTRPEPEHKLVSFYNLVAPGGFWRPIRDKINTTKKTVLGWSFLINWFAGIALIYGTTFGIGKIIFEDFITGGILLIIAGIGFSIIYIGLRKGLV